jgi:hypothetical protein
MITYGSTAVVSKLDYIMTPFQLSKHFLILCACIKKIFFSLPFLKSTHIRFLSTDIYQDFVLLKYFTCVLNRTPISDYFKRMFKSRDSSVGIALGYGLDDRGSRVRFPVVAGNLSLHHRVQNGSGAHPASYQMGTRGSSPGDKAAGP